MLSNPVTLEAVHRLTQPVRLLMASRGMLDEDHGLYDPQWLAALGLNDRVAVETVEEVNHYTILIRREALELVAHHIAEMAGVE